MSDAWAGIQVNAVSATGDLQQIFPTWFGTGDATTTVGSLRRKPREGVIYSVDIEPDGTNGGTIEIWDLNADEIGVNVNTATTITNAELVILQARGLAKLLWSQVVSGTSGASLKGTSYRPFQKGIAARFINSGPTGYCRLNLEVDGGAVKQPIAGT